MSLDKNFWENDKTPLSADNLNAMTNQIVDNSDEIEDLKDAIKGTPDKIAYFDSEGKIASSDISKNNVVTTDILEEGLSSKSNKVNNSTAYSLVCFGDTDGTLVESEISEFNVITTYNLADNVIDKADKVTGATSGHLASLNGDGNLVDSGINKDTINELSTELNSKQETLISGENIKTINGESILGEGNIEIEGGSGGSITVDEDFSPTSPNAQSGYAVAEAIKDKMNVKIVSELPAKGDESTIYAVTKTEQIVVDGKDYVEFVTTIDGSGSGNTSYVVRWLSYVDGDDGVVANADLAGQYGAIEIIISDPYIAYCIEHSTKIETNDRSDFTKFDIYVPITTSNRYLFVNGRYIDICVGEKTSDNGEIFNTYEDIMYSFSQYPQYNAKVLNSSSANRENGQAYKNKSISEKTTTSGSSNISGCRAFKIIGHSDVRGLNGGAGHYYIEKNSESIKLVEDYYDEDVNKTKLYGCYSTWLFTNTGGNNRAEMVESTITISEDGDRYKINVSNFTNLESVNSNFADNVSYIRFYEKYEQSVGNNQTRFIPMPLVELGDTSIEGWSYAGGLNNKAVGLGSFVIGNENIADGAYSFIAGRQNIGGFTSFVAGRWNKVGQYGAAFGQLNEVSGINSLAAGSGNKIGGKSSTAFGESNVVSSVNSFISGYGNISESKNSLVSGLYNKLHDILVQTNTFNTYTGVNGTESCHWGGNQGFSVTKNKLKVSMDKGGNNHTIQINQQDETAENKYLKLKRNTDYILVLKLTASKAHDNVDFKVYEGVQLSYSEKVKAKYQLNSGKSTRSVTTGEQVISLPFKTTKDLDRTHLFLQFRCADTDLTLYISSIELYCYDKLVDIGNGTSESSRDTAFAVYQDGHAEVQTIGDSNNSIVTKKYVGDNYATKSHGHGGTYSKVSVMTGSGYTNEANSSGINIYIGNDEPSKTNIPIGSLWIKPAE